MNMGQRLFDIAGSAAYLRELGAVSCTVTFIRQLIATGQVPHVRIGKKFYVSRDALDGWIGRHERKAR
jgi:excisionase family DNA binding protein